MTEKAIDLIQFDRSGRLHRVGSGHFSAALFSATRIDFNIAVPSLSLFADSRFSSLVVLYN